MKFQERKNCPICSSFDNQVLFHKNFGDSSLRNFIKENFPKIFSIKSLKNYKYILINCKYCNFIYQKKILSNKSSEFFYNEIISQEDSFEKKKNFSVSDFEVYFKDLKKIENLFKKKT